MSVTTGVKSLCSERVFLKEWSTCVELLNYEWNLTGKTVSSKQFATVTVEAQLCSRYSFTDNIQLKIDLLSNYQSKVAEKIFDLKKTAQLQSFSFQIWKDGNKFDDSAVLAISATMYILPSNYYAKDPVTVAQLKSSNTPHDIVLTVGSQSYYLQKSYLATWSRYFANYFKKEPDTTTLDLKEISWFSSYFEILLDSIYPGVDPDVTDLSFPLLINLAMRFEVPAVLVKCESYWKSFNNASSNYLRDPARNEPCRDVFMSSEVLLERLIMADRYNLPQLQLACFHHYKNALSEVEQEDFLEEQKKQFRLLSLNIVGNLFTFPKNGLIDRKWLTSKKINHMKPTLNEPELTDPIRTNDIVISVEQKNFYLNKEYLSIWSNYFDRMFSAGFSEQTQQKVVLKEVDAEEFGTLMQIIHPATEYIINDENVWFLMKLADRFEMMSVICLCEKNLINCVNEHILIDLLALSDQYNLVNLQVRCLTILHKKSGKAFKEFLDQHRDVIKEFSRNTLANLI